MKKVICKVTYDTEKAELIKKSVRGVFGDPKGSEESLFQNEKGNFFLYVNGGSESDHPTEDIVRMSKEKAQDWLAKH